MTRPFAVVAFVVAAACASIVACGPDQGPPYGGANALQGVSPPVVAPPPSACDGGPPVNPSCGVSFAAQIMPILSTKGSGGCSATSCHGTGLPPVITSDPKATWKNLTEQRITTAAKTELAYVNLCSLSAEASGISCNIQPTASPNGCGSHMPQQRDMPAADLAVIKTWLECGSPNN